MKITKDTIVTITFRATDTKGLLLEDGKEPRAYLHGHNNTLPGIEKALEGQEKGFAATLELQPEDAFGVRDERLVQTIPKSEFPPGVKVGGQLQGVDDSGQQQVFNVVKIKGDTVHLDGNHPRAGQVMRFSVKVVDVQPASAEELAHGHAHGAHGHHH